LLPLRVSVFVIQKRPVFVGRADGCNLSELSISKSVTLAI